MEFSNTQSSRSTGSSPSNKLPINFYDVISTTDDGRRNILFNTKNATSSVPKITNTPSSTAAPEPNHNGPKCILSWEGLARPDHFEHTRGQLPLTKCSTHGKASFLPLDCVAKLPEYTRAITRATPVPKVVHSIFHCILEFPNPPPISSSEEKLFRRDDYLNKCYQCLDNLDFPKSIYMYRDYLFCCLSCRYKASVTHYWYRKAMNIVDDEDDAAGEVRKLETAAMDDTEGVVFFIDL